SVVGRFRRSRSWKSSLLSDAVTSTNGTLSRRSSRGALRVALSCAESRRFTSTEMVRPVRMKWSSWR
ncbi:hypothetical protein AAVH_42448, partial [Aphelenchoides avenae]